VWSNASLRASTLRLRASRSQYPPVPCPKTPPSTQIPYTADGVCHEVPPSQQLNYWKLEDDAEVSLYDLKPFAVPGVPKTFDDAAERALYCLVNDALVDMGSPIYGQVSSVFSQESMRQSVLLSAVDTGGWEIMCNRSLYNMSGAANCSAYAPFRQLGTMDHFYHLFLINEAYWTGRDSLAYRFKRFEEPWGSHPFTVNDLLSYFEAIPTAPIRFPEDVRFLIGDFPNLFGTEEGALLQDWAKQRKWVLVWSLGLNLGAPISTSNFELLGAGKEFPGNQRLVDPVVAAHSSAYQDLPQQPSIQTAFQQRWQEAVMLRSQNATNVTWAKQWNGLVSSMPVGLQLRPLRGGECSRPAGAPECLGKSANGDCICYSHRLENPSSLVISV